MDPVGVGRRGGDLVGQRPEHGLGLFQAHRAAVAGGGGLGRDALAVVAGAVIGAAVQRVGALARWQGAAA
ncbi:hypothetical protein GCM10010412_064210 [Nonomuraea recticatena]|uniref:Uncharacterized protein n=1 Tax=Nonomuraea recticatena TaxID=46178 RepID=A0ABN3SLQ3_9ACTN